MYFIDEPPNVYRTAKDKIDIQGRNSFWRQFQMAPQAEDNGHEDGLHEGVTGVDGIEGPGQHFMDDRAHQKHSLESDPDPQSRLDGRLPVGEPERHNKACKYDSDDEIMNKLGEDLARRFSSPRRPG
jgi:hypothetical protein